MKKNIILIISLIFSAIVHAQVGVGINTDQPQGIFHINGGGTINDTNTKNDVVVSHNEGNVAIGHISPSVKLDIKTTGTAETPVTGFKLTDGTQNSGYVLKSDSDGIGSWKTYSLKTVRGQNLGDEFNIPFVPASGFKCTGAYIDLPPGKWLVTIYQLLNPRGPNLTADQWMFLRTTFSDQQGLNQGDAATKTPDIASNPAQVSFLIKGPTSLGVAGVGTENRRMDIQNGALIIENKSNSAKRYYYIAGEVIIGGTQSSDIYLRSFSGDWAENLISAIEITN